MDELCASGTTFSTSGKPWTPFRGSLKVRRRNARLRRLMKAKIIKPMTKDEMREANADVVR